MFGSSPISSSLIGATAVYTGITLNGTITTLPITNRENLTLLSAPVTVYIYNDVTGALVTSLSTTTHPTTGALVVAHASIVATVMYRVVIMLEDSSLGIERIRAL